MTIQKADNRKAVWVHPEFGRVLKVASANEGLTVIEVTRRISTNPEPLMQLVKDIKDGKKKYDMF